MGLLEKALKYKKEINRKGRETLIDTIPGPAETDFVDEAAMEDSGDRSAAAAHDAGTDQPATGADADDAVIRDDELALLDAEDLKQVDEPDDLFTLPDDDGAAPHEVIESQRQGTPRATAVDAGSAPLAGAVRRSGSAAHAAPQFTGPFGTTDEPDLKGAPAVQRSTEQQVVIRDEFSTARAIEATADSVDGAPGEAVDEPSDRAGANGKPDKRAQDFMILFEIGKEIMSAENRKALYDAILFSIMGQIGASSSSIMVRSSEDTARWTIADSRGVTIRNKQLYFDESGAIFKSLLESGGIIDIETYKDDPEHRDEYYKFISIDGRLLAPLSHAGEIVGILVLGDKITIGNYSDEECDFIAAMGEISAVAMRKINMIDRLQEERDELHAASEHVANVDSLARRMIEFSSLRGLCDIVARELGSMSVESFAVFIGDERNDVFVPVMTEDNDLIGLRGDDVRIAFDSPFTDLVQDLKDRAQIADFDRLKIIRDAFGESAIKRMTHFWVYPFKIGVKLLGFVLVFQIADVEREREIDRMIGRLSTFLVPYLLMTMRMDFEENRYVDNIELVLKRINREILKAQSLKIPLTLVLFSIKNFKRYLHLFGLVEAKKLIAVLEGIIVERLSDPDFAIRYDRNKILIVLPGKNKKFSVPLANTIRNEVLQRFKNREMQLLVTFLTAEYPEDGADLYTLLDGID